MTNLVKYRPGRVLFNWDTLFDRFIDDVPNLGGSVPAADVREDEAQYTLEVELPGLTEKDIEVKVENDLLSLASKREKNKKEEKKGYLIRERSRFEFSRSFTLPDAADREQISAEFKNGLLTLVIPQVAKAQPKLIDVRVN